MSLRFGNGWCGHRPVTALLLVASASLSFWTVVRAGDGALSRTILFADDHNVLYRPGTERVLVPLRRYAGNPLIKGKEKPWEVAIAWSSVYRNPDTGHYQIWYQAFAGEAAQDRTRRCTVCYAESEDGIHFKRPNCDLYDFNGIKDTSIVLVSNGGTSDRYGVSVVVDPRESNPARRYKMAYFDFTRENGREYPGLNVAFSPDGVHWSKHPHGPLSRASYGRYGASLPFQDDPNRPWDLPLSMADALDVFYDPLRQVFAIYGKMWIDGPDGRMYWKHAMGRIESKDFTEWTKPQLVLTPDERDPGWVEFHTAPVGFYQGLYFSPLQILDRKTGGGVVDIELATSRDGLRWERPFRKELWLARSSGDRFDSGAIFVCPQAVVLEDEVRFYYGAYSQGATGSDDSRLASGIGLATMARDRFAGLRPVPQSDLPALNKTVQNIGQITLKPIDFSRITSLTLNADASCGAIRVELLDAEGKRVRGFSKEDALVIRGDSLHHPVRWHSPAGFPAGEHMLRLHLESATVYALTLKYSTVEMRNPQ